MSWKYNAYLEKHRKNVEDALEWMRQHELFGEQMWQILQGQGWRHDDSKYDDEEYEAYDDYFYGAEGDKDQKAFDYAWLHHVHHNPHHWQYWILQEDDGDQKALEMPEEYVWEMIADWWTFGLANDEPMEIFKWYEEHKDKMILHEKTRKMVEEILEMMKTELEEEEAQSGTDEHPEEFNV